MPSPPREFIKGTALVAALVLMSADANAPTVKWLVGGEVARIPAAMALCIARATTYEGKFHKGRVYFIREVLTRPAPVFDEEFRRGRAILRWDKPVDTRTVDLWDRILGNPRARAKYSNVVPSGTAAAASL